MLALHRLAVPAPRAVASAVSTPATSSSVLAGAPARSAVPKFAAPDAARDRATAPTSTAHAQARESDGASGAAPFSFFTPRGPRFADYTTCLMCGRERLGLEYQGELLSGVKLHTLAAHSPGAGRTIKGEPRCLGAGMRMKFTAAGWVSL